MLANPLGHQRGNPIVSKAVNHFWYGDTSPWTERRLEHSFEEPQARPTTKVVILDRENPPQMRSARTVETSQSSFDFSPFQNRNNQADP